MVMLKNIYYNVKIVDIAALKLSMDPMLDLTNTLLAFIMPVFMP